MMFGSLSNRMAGLAAIVVAALVSLAGLLADASRQTSASFALVTHSALVIETTQMALVYLRAAEAGQRGFIITHDPAYTRSFNRQVSSSLGSIGRVIALAQDNPAQQNSVRELAELMANRVAVMRQTLDVARRGNFAGAADLAVRSNGNVATDMIVRKARAFLAEERRLQDGRKDATERRLAANLRLMLIGASGVAVLVMAGFALLIRSIRRPLDTLLRAMTSLGEGERGARVTTAMGSTEFARLAQGYNAMADRLEHAVGNQARSELRLQDVNAELHRRGETLRERGDVIELLGGMAHRMQASRTDEELASVIRVFAPRVLPGIPGALFAHNNSRNLLAPIAAWGGLDMPAEGFAPDQCWALRRGQSHYLAAPSDDIVCGHVAGDTGYHCEPLLAGGEVIGVLFLHGQVEAESRFRLTALAENIASALVNHRLQRSLREQTIRDPLTGLFNRRYMEETLQTEIARTARSGVSLGLVMCDVDHFKRFNDEFGHEAGDAVLKAVAAEMRNRFRDGDVVCRFGGEEFTIIAPGTTDETLMQRVEIVRQAISELSVRHDGRMLGAVSMSFGIATWSKSMARDGSDLVQAADAALYQAKRAGRNRTTISRLAA